MAEQEVNLSKETITKEPELQSRPQSRWNLIKLYAERTLEGKLKFVLS